MIRSKPKETVIKRLFALSGNRCAFPDCEQHLIDEDGFVIGEICHIEAALPGGERYNPNQSEEERRDFSNLVLFCRNHHAKTNNEAKYSVELLKEYKRRHEVIYESMPYQIPLQFQHQVLQKIYVDLQKVYDVVIQTKEVVENNNEQLQSMDGKMDSILEMHRALLGMMPNHSAIYSDHLKSILQLRTQGKLRSALEALLQFKKDNWEKIDLELQFKIQANLGILYLDLNERDKAGIELIKIAEINYNTADALSYLSFGYAQQKQIGLFEETFSKALAIEATNANLWIAYIEAYSFRKSTDEISKSIPEKILLKPEIQFALGQLHIQNGKIAEGLVLLKNIILQNDLAGINRWYLEAIIVTAETQQIIQWEKLPLNSLSASDRNTVHGLIEKLGAIWTSIENTESKIAGWFILANRGICYSAIGEKASALKDFITVWEYHKSAETYRNLLSFCIELNDLELANNIVNERDKIAYHSEDDRITVEIFTCRFWITIGSVDKANNTIDTVIMSAQGIFRPRALNSAVLLLSEAHRYLRAAEIAQKILVEFPDYPDGYISLGSCLVQLGKREEGIKNLDIAISLLHSKENKPVLWIQLATEFWVIKEYAKAAYCLEQYPEDKSFTEINVMKLRSYFSYKDFQRSIVIAEQILQDEPLHPFVNEILVRSYFAVEKNEQAINLLNKYFEIGAKETFDQLRLVAIQNYIVKGMHSEAAAFASALSSLNSLGMNQKFTIADLLVNFGDTQKGREIAYATRMQFYDKMEAHQAYFHIIINKDAPEEELYPQHISMECGLILTDETGFEKHYFLTDNPTHKGVEVLRSDTPLAQLLIGKQKGELIVNSAIVGKGHKMLVKEVMDKYTFAFRESANLLATNYAGRSGLFMGSF